MEPQTLQTRTPQRRGKSSTQIMVVARHNQFLAELRMHGNVSLACQAVGVSRSAAYEYRQNHPDFCVLWDDALEQAADALEGEAYRRAVVGVDEPVFYKGKQVGTVRKFSDQLLITLLKASREKFRTTRAEVTAPQLDVRQMSDAELRAELAAIMPYLQSAIVEGDVVATG